MNDPEITFNPDTSRWEFIYKGILRNGKTLEEAKFFMEVLKGTYALINQTEHVLGLIKKEFLK